MNPLDPNSTPAPPVLANGTASKKPAAPTTDAADYVTVLLFAGMLIFTILLIIVEKFFHDDGQIFQVMAGLVTGFSGAFFTRIKGASPPKNTTPDA
jgi:hypothetical protein